jgi:trehalose 2-sulfotransferase
MMPLFLPKELLAHPNEHGDLIQAHFGAAAADLAAIPSGIRFVFIYFTNRCGSHFLADALAPSGALNRAGEMFNAEIVVGDSKAYGLRDLGQFMGHLARTASRNGILVTKATVTQISVLAQSGIMDHILARTSFLLLERDDKLGQAISYALALGTNQWTSAHEARVAAASVPFNPDLLRGFIGGVATEIALFHRFFGLNGITPLHVSYEMLAAMPETVVPWIGAWLGLPQLQFVAPELRVRRQANEINQRWREWFLNQNR